MRQRIFTARQLEAAVGARVGVPLTSRRVGIVRGVQASL